MPQETELLLQLQLQRERPALAQDPVEDGHLRATRKQAPVLEEVEPPQGWAQDPRAVERLPQQRPQMLRRAQDLQGDEPPRDWEQHLEADAHLQGLLRPLLLLLLLRV